MEVNGHRTMRTRDHIIQENGDVKLLKDVEFDPWTSWAYKPRTISLLLFGACLLMYIGYFIAFFSSTFIEYI